MEECGINLSDLTEIVDDQTLNRTKEKRAKSYLIHFVTQARKRANDMITKFVKPFEKYIT
jgi:type II restriction enzyme